jgi:hypothetical protein
VVQKNRVKDQETKEREEQFRRQQERIREFQNTPTRSQAASPNPFSSVKKAPVLTKTKAMVVNSTPMQIETKKAPIITKAKAMAPLTPMVVKKKATIAPKPKAAMFTSTPMQIEPTTVISPVQVTPIINNGPASNNVAGDSSTYDMTMEKVFQPGTEDDYNVNDLSSGDETDEESKPRKNVPGWAVSMCFF